MPGRACLRPATTVITATTSRASVAQVIDVVPSPATSRPPIRPPSAIDAEKNVMVIDCDEQAWRAAERQAPRGGGDVDQHRQPGEDREHQHADREQHGAGHGQLAQVVVDVRADHEHAQHRGHPEREEHPAGLAAHADRAEELRHVGVEDVVRDHVRGQREQDRLQPGNGQRLPDGEAFVLGAAGQVRHGELVPRHVQQRQRGGHPERGLPAANVARKVPAGMPIASEIGVPANASAIARPCRPAGEIRAA